MSVIITTPGDDVYEFRLDLFQPPAIRYVEPPSVYTPDGLEWTISMNNFPAITRADEVTLKIDNSEQLVRSVRGNSAAFLMTVIVPPMEVGVYVVSISSSRYSYLGDIRFDLCIEARSPEIQSVRPSVDSMEMEGSDIVDVKIVYMTPVVSANAVSEGTKKRIVFLPPSQYAKEVSFLVFDATYNSTCFELTLHNSKVIKGVDADHIIPVVDDTELNSPEFNVEGDNLCSERVRLFTDKYQRVKAKYPQEMKEQHIARATQYASRSDKIHKLCYLRNSEALCRAVGSGLAAKGKRSAKYKRSAKVKRYDATPEPVGPTLPFLK